MQSLYEFSEVSFTAPARENGRTVTILCDATFTINAGVFTVITGTSGAGKSTLLRLFNRLADPSSGSIKFRDRDIMDYPIRELRRGIGWVPQEPVRFPGTVLDNLQLPFIFSRDHKFTKDEIASEINDLFRLDLLPEGISDRDVESLSVGEAQRLNLMRALALRPEVLLLDEPTSALDQETSDNLLSRIEKLRENRSLTMIMVSHKADEVIRMGEKVIGICDGVARITASNGGHE